ncbi:MAG: hypothetical protein RRZ42_03530 [Oscillospiraceae bacterium]
MCAAICPRSKAKKQNFYSELNLNLERQFKSIKISDIANRHSKIVSVRFNIGNMPAEKNDSYFDGTVSTDAFP